MLKSFFSSTKGTLAYPYLRLNLMSYKQMRGETPIKLISEEINHLMEVHQLSNWNIDPQFNKMSRQLKFENFQEAFSFMNSIAFLAEEIQHHPEWHNCYNVVKVDLNTHDVNGLSIKDFVLAHAMENLALQYQIKSAEGVQDIRQLEVMKLIENWNQNQDKHQEITQNLKAKANTV